MRGDISIAALYRDVAILESALIVGAAAAVVAAAIVSVVNVAIRRRDITEDIVGVADLDSALLILGSGSHFCGKRIKSYVLYVKRPSFLMTKHRLRKLRNPESSLTH